MRIVAFAFVSGFAALVSACASSNGADGEKSSKRVCSQVEETGSRLGGRVCRDVEE